MVNAQQPVPVQVGQSRRLEAATVAHRDAQETARNAAISWRREVVAAIDAGMPQRQVAALAGVSTARVHAIVVRESLEG